MALGQPPNGRVYDATLGRFTTADPLIQVPSFSQSYNRYTYGFNNPLSGSIRVGSASYTGRCALRFRIDTD